MRARVLWWWCWFVYLIYLALPWVVARRCNFMLPTVGAYAFSDSFDEFKATFFQEQSIP